MYFNIMNFNNSNTFYVNKKMQEYLKYYQNKAIQNYIKNSNKKLNIPSLSMQELPPIDPKNILDNNSYHKYIIFFSRLLFTLFLNM